MAKHFKLGSSVCAGLWRVEDHPQVWSLGCLEQVMFQYQVSDNGMVEFGVCLKWLPHVVPGPPCPKLGAILVELSNKFAEPGIVGMQAPGSPKCG